MRRQRCRGQAACAAAGVSGRRRLLQAALRSLGQPEISPDAGAAASLWAQFSVTEKCNGCRECAPSSAPPERCEKIEQEGKIGLVFRLADCTNCRLCQDVCVRNAVVLSPQIDLREVVAGTSDVIWLQPEKKTPLWQAALRGGKGGSS